MAVAAPTTEPIEQDAAQQDAYSSGTPVQQELARIEQPSSANARFDAAVQKYSYVMGKTRDLWEAARPQLGDAEVDKQLQLASNNTVKMFVNYVGAANTGNNITDWGQLDRLDQVIQTGRFLDGSPTNFNLTPEEYTQAREGVAAAKNQILRREELKVKEGNLATLVDIFQSERDMANHDGNAMIQQTKMAHLNSVADTLTNNEKAFQNSNIPDELKNVYAENLVSVLRDVKSAITTGNSNLQGIKNRATALASAEKVAGAHLEAEARHEKFELTQGAQRNNLSAYYNERQNLSAFAYDAAHTDKNMPEFIDRVANHVREGNALVAAGYLSTGELHEGELLNLTRALAQKVYTPGVHSQIFPPTLGSHSAVNMMKSQAVEQQARADYGKAIHLANVLDGSSADHAYVSEIMGATPQQEKQVFDYYHGAIRYMMDHNVTFSSEDLQTILRNTTRKFVKPTKRLNNG